MGNFRDNDDIDKLKNEERQLEIKKLDYKTAKLKTLTAIIVFLGAIISLIPTNSPDEHYLPIIVLIIRELTGEESPPPNTPTPVSSVEPTMVPTSQPSLAPATVTPSPIPTNTPILTATFTPLPTNTPVPTATPTFTAPISSIDDSNGLTREQLNELFGENNWYCFGDRYSDGVEIVPERNNGIGIKQQQFRIPIAYPIASIYSNNYPNGLDNGIASGGNFGAVVDFTNQLYLPPDQCPVWQLEALEQWRLDRQNLGYLRPFDSAEISQFFGELAWNCTSYFSISAPLNDDYLVSYPSMFVSGNAHQRDFGIGETVPASSFQATFWLNGSVERCE